MKSKLPVFLLGFFLAFFLFSPSVLAAEFKLNSIGSLDVSTNLYSSMWYTGSQPTFSGTGTSGATVNIVLDTNSYSTTVDGSEQWSWTPPEALANADHNLTFSADGQTISLVLTTGSAAPADLSSSVSTQTASPAAIPTAGVFLPTLVLLVGAGLMITYPTLRKLVLRT